MADIKKGSDLITTISETEKRLKKVERQLAVPRRGLSSVITEESNVTGAWVGAGDSVTVVATANCLIHLFMQLDAKIAGANTATAFIKDVTNGNYLYDCPISNTSYLSYASAPGSRYDTINPHDFADYRTESVAAAGGVVTIPYATAGSLNFELEFLVGAATTLTIKNRKLFAWVQPF